MNTERETQQTIDKPSAADLHLQDRFDAFLSVNSLKQEFKISLYTHSNRTLTDYLYETSPELFIEDAFYWNKTLYGEKRWNELNLEWIEIVKGIRNA